MDHIRKVIRQTSTPTWINSVPYNFGDAAAGKLKADEWRTLGTIYLPLALVVAWGNQSAHMTPVIGKRAREILDHTMELVSAVTLACKRSTTVEVANAYSSHIETYLRDLSSIHPSCSFLPNMHVSTHIADFLLLFGPVYSWWTFPYERLIGLLQSIPSNDKSGKNIIPYH